MTSNLSKVEGSRISLFPPLEFKSALFGFGKVVEISGTDLNLTVELPESDLAQSTDRISITLPSADRFEFSIEQMTKISEHAIHAKISHGQNAVIDDLLGIVRKNQHLSICNQKDVESSDRYNGFSELNFIPHALPNLSWNELNTKTTVFGETFDSPLFITGMTGGVVKGAEINRRLALAAQSFNIPMGVGSQRIALENPKHAPTFQVRKFAPDIFLVANIGLSQLKSPNHVSLDLCKSAVAMIEADALAIHLNTMQELIQVEGQRDFRGIIDQIGEITNSVGVPVIIKEVGSGLDLETARQLVDAGIKTVDIAGRGGTSWPYVEGLRSENSARFRLANTFRNWGIPTAHALAAIKSEIPELEIIATGGIRDGLEVAKAVALGASAAGIGLPLMKAALTDEDEPKNVLGEFVDGLKLSMMGTDSKKIYQLKKRIVFGNPYENRLYKHAQNVGKLPADVGQLIN